MYNENDKHCRECICVSCSAFRKDDCLDGKDMCEKCDNKSHTGSCPWFNDREGDTRDMEYTRAKFEERLRMVVGPYYIPREERYQ